MSLKGSIPPTPGARTDWVRRAIVVVPLVLVTVFGTIAAIQASNAGPTFPEARANYERHVERLVKCLAGAGHDAVAKPSDNGVFYNIEVQLPPTDSEQSWDAANDEFSKAIDSCTSADLLRATADVEALTRPSDEKMAAIIQDCAPGSESSEAGASDMDDLLLRAASTSPESHQCIMRAISDHTRTFASQHD